jgi:hypothetical protein
VTISNKSGKMWNWENPSSKTEVVGTEVFFCDNKYQISFTGNQDLSVYTSFGRKGGRGKNLKLDVFAKFDIDDKLIDSETRSGGFVRIFSQRIQSGKQIITKKDIMAKIIDDEKLANKVFLDKGNIETVTVLYDPVSKNQALQTEEYTIRQKITVTELLFTSKEVDKTKLNIKFFFEDKQDHMNVNDIEWKLWNDLLRSIPDQERLAKLAVRRAEAYGADTRTKSRLKNEEDLIKTTQLKLSNDIKFSNPLFNETKLGFDKFLSINNSGIIEENTPDRFEWNRPTFSINDDMNALVVSVDYPDEMKNLTTSHGPKLIVEVDGSNDKFIDDLREFFRSKQWVIEKTENYTLELGENRFRIEVLRNTTQLAVSKDSISQNKSPIQVKLLSGPWSPIPSFGRVEKLIEDTNVCSQPVESKEVSDEIPDTEIKVLQSKNENMYTLGNDRESQIRELKSQIEEIEIEIKNVSSSGKGWRKRKTRLQRKKITTIGEISKLKEEE